MDNMGKYLFLLILTFFIFSCGKDKEKERERAKYVEDSIAKANEERRFRDSVIRIQPAPEPKPEVKKPTAGSMLSAFPQKWVLLGNYRSQKVVFIPCGAEEAPHFILQDVGTANPKIFFNYGSEQRTFFISNIRQTKGVYKFNLVRYFEDEGGMTSTYDNLDLDVNNKGKELIVDMVINEPGVPKTRFDMIPESEVKNYMTVKQDKSECE
jgi:hypothetical protein